MTDKIEVAELQYAQGDVVMAAQMIALNNLSLDTEGATECARLMREYGKGNRFYWSHENYLRSSIHMAQECVRVAGYQPKENV
jgi:hypothetical protein